MMLTEGRMAKKGRKVSKGKIDQEQKGTKEETQTEAAVPKASPQPVAPKPAPRPKTALERRQEQIDGIKKTVYPAILGVIAGLACYQAGPLINQLPWHFVLIVIVAATYIVQRVSYSFLGIDANSFQGKDWFYVEFMAVDLWLVTWTILLN